MRLTDIICGWCKLNSETIEGKKYTIENPWVIFRKSGVIKLTNGDKYEFNRNNKKEMLRIILFALDNGVTFNNKEEGWKLDDQNGIIETPTGIRFDIRSFDNLIFSETFLYDIHFVEFDLVGKTVIQGGGFTGDTALYFASRGAKVYSFEPDPNSFNLAINNIKLNPHLQKNIVMKNYAIGKDEIIKFPVNPAGSGGSSLYNSHKGQVADVRSVSIKTIMSEFNIEEPYLLDLDIKGSEFDVINDNAIKNFEILRIEYTTKIGEKIIGERNYLINKLKEYGFNMIRIYKHNILRYDLCNHGTIEARKKKENTIE